MATSRLSFLSEFVAISQTFNLEPKRCGIFISYWTTQVCALNLICFLDDELDIRCVQYGIDSLFCAPRIDWSNC